MGRWGDRYGDGKRRREWEEIRGEEWSSGRWEAGETGRAVGEKKRMGGDKRRRVE
jgi:hypothetical protein